MGTRSLTFVYSENNRSKLMCLYRQFDGYPSGHGAELAEFLDGRNVVNGYGSNMPEKTSNGMGCLSASLVASLKDGIGNIYLYPTNTKDAWQDYEYHVYSKKVVVKDSSGEVLFSGTWEEFKEYCKEE